MRTDVIVVGAGASGLACARRLVLAGLGVTVLESRHRVGGRIHTYRPADGGPPLELGAQVVHGDRNPVHALVGADRMVAVPRDVTARVVSGGVGHDMGLLARGRRAPWLLEALLRADPAPVGTGPDRAADVGSWLRAHGVRGEEDRAVREWFRQAWAAEPDALDARGTAAAYRDDTVGHPVGDGEFAVAGGFDRLPALLAEGLDVRLGSPVHGLRFAPGRVEARTGDGTFRAAAAVVTVPPPVVGSGGLPIEDLPAAKLDAAKRLVLGDGCCAVAVLDRDAPETAVVFDVDGHGGFLRVAAGRPEVLVVAKAGAAAAVRAAAAERDGLLPLLRRALPWASSARTTGVTVADWGGDPWSRGAFTAPLTGAADAAPAWAEPVDGTLFFAGEATVSGSRLPWVHGALASGERAAEQTIEAISR